MLRSRAFMFAIKEFKELIAPTLFFAVSFNIIVLTTQLILDDYLIRLASFLVATTAALVVGKAVLIANALPLLRRFDQGPLIRPIMFKTRVYFVVVFVVRFLEKIIEYVFGGGTLAGHSTVCNRTFYLAPLCRHPDLDLRPVLNLCHRNRVEYAVRRWRTRQDFFPRRSSDLKLTRRQRIRSLVKLGHLTDAHTLDELQDRNTTAHQELVRLIRLISRPNPSSASHTGTSTTGAITSH